MDSLIRFWLGVDVSKLKLDVALLDERGKVKSKMFANSAQGVVELRQWLSERGASPLQSRICMEATGPYSEASATALVDAGWTVSVVNPARVKGFAQGEMQRNKTDTADAGLLARFCSRLTPEPWQPPPQAVRELRALVDRLQVIKDIQAEETNRLEAHADKPTLVKSINEHITWLQTCAQALQREIDDHIEGHPELKRDAQLLHSIPGLGTVTVPKVLALLGDVRRFKSAKALSAFIGVTPRLRESGSSVRGRSMMSRTGHAQMRRALYMPALVALRHNAAVKVFAQRLKATGLAPKAVIGACMHKMAMLIFGVLKSGVPFDLKLALPGVDFQDGI